MNEPKKGQNGGEAKAPEGATAPGATAEQRERNMRATTAAKAQPEVAKEAQKDDPWVVGPKAQIVKGSGRVLAPGEVVAPELFGHTTEGQLSKFDRLVKAGKVVRRSEFQKLKRKK